jgi:hypothetical protein
MAVSEIVFQASDLIQHSRQVLDAARAGEARVRDKDGLSLLILPEQRVAVWRTIAQVAANLATVDHHLRESDASLSLGAYGEWTWLRHLPADDLHLFRDEIRQALIVAAREESLTLLATTLREWRLTAEQLADPTRRAVLLGRPALTEFVEVARPSADEG